MLSIILVSLFIISFIINYILYDKLLVQKDKLYLEIYNLKFKNETLSKNFKDEVNYALKLNRKIKKLNSEILKLKK